ncbi:MAG: hypothetical protein V2I56_15940 [Desulfobacteraceae bacterium]|jgi:hypothetical protein|nr:hypothetical protein [Desulfobacteraceae bacterium]
MPKKKGKTTSFDAMVKFFMLNYDIPTKRDVDKLMAKLDRLEILIKQSASGASSGRASHFRSRTALTAVDIVLDTIKNSRQGLGFTEIQASTGFDEKKIRNIIFRLNKIGKIKRKQRGIYIAS